MTITDPASGRRAAERRGEKLTAATQVYSALKRDILNGALKPGEKLQIDQVAGRYGAGSNPVREALNRLSAERLVDREDQRGFRVPPLSLEHFRELVKTRCWLESLALGESIRNRTDAWEDEAIIALHRLRRTPLRYPDEVEAAGGPGDNSEWEARHRAFHRALISNCGSGWLLHFCDELMDQVERFRYISMTNTYPRRQADEEHRQILEAALAGDAALATSRLVAQYQLTLRLFEEHVASAAGA